MEKTAFGKILVFRFVEMPIITISHKNRYEPTQIQATQTM